MSSLDGDVMMDWFWGFPAIVTTSTLLAFGFIAWSYRSSEAALRWPRWIIRTLRLRGPMGLGLVCLLAWYAWSIIVTFGLPVWFDILAGWFYGALIVSMYHMDPGGVMFRRGSHLMWFYNGRVIQPHLAPAGGIGPLARWIVRANPEPLTLTLGLVRIIVTEFVTVADRPVYIESPIDMAAFRLELERRGGWKVEDLAPRKFPKFSRLNLAWMLAGRKEPRWVKRLPGVPAQWRKLGTLQRFLVTKVEFESSEETTC